MSVEFVPPQKNKYEVAEIEFIQQEIQMITKKIEHEKINLRILKERYEKQLELYRHGAKALFNTDNVKCLLYSFRLGQFIEF